jgi:hypothetical protein
VRAEQAASGKITPSTATTVPPHRKIEGKKGEKWLWIDAVRVDMEEKRERKRGFDRQGAVDRWGWG